MKKYIFLILILTNKIFSNNTNILDLYKKQLEICDQLKDPKAVQECKNNILLLAAIHNNYAIQQKIENKIETKSQDLKKPESNISNNLEDYDPTSDVLKSFAGVIACFGKMVMSPQDPINVGTSLCGILAGMVNIVATVTKKN